MARFFSFMATETLAETVQRLQDILEPALVREGLELVALDLKRGQRGKGLLRIVIDVPGDAPYPTQARRSDDAPLAAGVSISDCVRVTKMLGPLLDVEDPLPTAYELEVSSPGVNRPLRKRAHYERALGARVRVKTRIPVRGTKLFIAPLAAAGEDAIALEVSGERLELPYRLISDARLEFEF